MSATGRLRSLPACHRIFAALVMLLWCAGPVLAALHAGEEAHRYCAEHGALEEVGELDGDVRAAGPDTPALTGEKKGAPSHEGCAFARFCRFGQSLTPFVLDATEELEPDSISKPALAMAAPSVAVILLAPKTSPPG